MHYPFASIVDLRELETQQQECVRQAPTSATERFRLFQILSMRGDWHNAARQLRQALNNDAALLPTISGFQSIVEAEVQREGCWRAQYKPSLVHGEELEWAQRLAEICFHQEPPEQLVDALAQAPALRGEIDYLLQADQPVRTATFEWIADGDSRLGPVLELIGQHGYRWLPLSEVRELRIAAPQDGCDRLWARADITRQDGEHLRAIIPVRYRAADYASQSDALLLGRETHWFALGDESLQVFGGEGQRMWITDAGEFALLDVRAIRLSGENP